MRITFPPERLDILEQAYGDGGGGVGQLLLASDLLAQCSSGGVEEGGVVEGADAGGALGYEGAEWEGHACVGGSNMRREGLAGAVVLACRR